MKLLFFRIHRGTDLVAVKQIEEKQVVFGNTENAVIRLEGQGVSPVHALVEERDGEYYLCDLGSEGGTRKNGKIVLDDVIHSGDTIEIGPYRIEFHIGIPKSKETVNVKPPPPPPVPPPGASKPATPTSSTAQSPNLNKVEKPGQHISMATTVSPSASSQLANQSGVKSDVTKTANVGGFASVETPRPQNRSSVVPPTGTFAPPSKHKSIDEIIKPARGNLVEVVVAWHERVLSTYQFEHHEIVEVGSHPDNHIVLPMFGATQLKHPFLKIEALATVFLTDAMSVELFQEKNKLTMDQLKAQNRVSTSGAGYSLTLEQGEMLKVSMGHGLTLVVRYNHSSSKPIAAPLFPFTSNELSIVAAGAIVGALLALIFAVYSPSAPEEVQEEEKQRVAQFIYPKRRAPVLSETIKEAPEATKDTPKGVKDQPITKEKPQDAEAGAASDAPRNNSKSTEKKLTSAKAGKSTGFKQGSARKDKSTRDGAPKAPVQRTDVTEQGLLGLFGKRGTQEAINRAKRGAGVLSDSAGSARGAGGQAAVGAGTVPGAGLKDLGAGGQGESSYGIAGVKTRGRGGGVSGYGTGTLGEKGRVTVIPGGAEEEFVGTIDKEGIRRVIQANNRQLQDCYEKGLNRDPSLSGKVVIEWDIGAQGRVLTAKVKSTSLNNSIVENCMVSRLRTWRFPEPPGGQTAGVIYPFVLVSPR